MRVDLALEHLIFVIFLLLFKIDLLFHQSLDIGSHLVQRPSDISEFIFPFDRRVGMKILTGNRLDLFLKMPDRRSDGKVQAQKQ